MGEAPGPRTGQARPPSAGSQLMLYFFSMADSYSQEYTLKLPFSCLKSGTTSHSPPVEMKESDDEKASVHVGLRNPGSSVFCIEEVTSV